MSLTAQSPVSTSPCPNSTPSSSSTAQMPYGPEPAHTLKRAEAHEKIFFLKKDKPEKDAIE